MDTVTTKYEECWNNSSCIITAYPARYDSPLDTWEMEGVEWKIWSNSGIALRHLCCIPSATKWWRCCVLAQDLKDMVFLQIFGLGDIRWVGHQSNADG